ncbi:MAG TPA: AAA domain-containing protein [Bacteroidia bacterium]|nr:AAA domain-containing protein [Bacteroidia bacterium]
MKIINQLQIIKLLHKFNSNISFWMTENEEGTCYDVLSIKENEDYKNLLDRIIKNEVIPMLNQKIDGVQKIVMVDFDEINNTHYIVYEHFEYSFQKCYLTINNLKKIVTGLKLLKCKNIFGFIFSKNTILTNKKDAVLAFVGLFELFKQQNLLDLEFLAPEVINGERPKFQSDIYSLFKFFASNQNNIQEPRLNNIFKKSLSENRIDRYSNYTELEEILNGIEDPSILLYTTRKNYIGVKTLPEHEVAFEVILKEMNQTCYIQLYSVRTIDRQQIQGAFSTINFSGKFTVNDDCIFIHLNNCQSSPNKAVQKNGFICEHGFEEGPSKFKCSIFFNEMWENMNSLHELGHSRTETLKKWRTLPEKEKEFIEEQAFKVEYLERELCKGNTTNIRFKLIEKFHDWNSIIELRKAKVYLSIEDKVVGQILDYNPKECSLILKDVKCSIDEMPENGKLFQDVKMETAQYKKQMEAVKKFEKGDIVNTDFASILISPENLKQINRKDIDYEGFKHEVLNENLKTNDTQREIVLEALHQKPIFLIQGPPGTGKTTIIVELIQQLIKRNSNVKILVTSQGNDAIDNVLKNFIKTNIQFMRLASQNTLDGEKVDKELISHTYTEKLKQWVAATQQKSLINFNELFLTESKDKALVEFYDNYLNYNLNDDKSLSKFYDLLKMESNYIKKIFSDVNDIKQVSKIFEKKLGKKFMQLKAIQKDWMAFINNAESINGEKKKSMLNNGSEEIDLLTAFVKQVNVIGATCIHIASGQYSKINFRFDYVIMDESSKATAAECLVPINMGQNLILIGDHKQLPPVITREETIIKKVKDDLEDEGLDMDKEFGESLFENLITKFEANENITCLKRMLDTQFRMPRQVGALISRYFYKNELKNPNINLLPDYDRSKFHELHFKIPTGFIYDNVLKKEVEVPNSIVFVSTSKSENPYDNGNKCFRQNKCNVEYIKATLEQLNNLYPNNTEKDKPFTIGIIAGYRGQVELLKGIDLLSYKNFVKTVIDEEGNEKLIPLIEVNTVDKFQGAERDIIIYDIVKSSPEKSNIGFLVDYRRMNVAFSRVKRLLIVVGDSEYILKRASIIPTEKFKEFKLQQIVQELKNQKLIINNFSEIIK